MRSKVNNGSDIGKLVLECMMTVFIVLIFLFIAQNWILTNTKDTKLTPTYCISDSGEGIGRPVLYETNKIIYSYELILQ